MLRDVHHFLPFGSLLLGIRAAAAFAVFFLMYPAAVVGDACLTVARVGGLDQPWRLSVACAIITFACSCSILLRIWWFTAWPRIPTMSLTVTVDSSLLSLVRAACEAWYILALATFGVSCLCSWFVLCGLLRHPILFTTWFALAWRAWHRS
jgi:hypothetical protein